MILNKKGIYKNSLNKMIGQYHDIMILLNNLMVVNKYF